MSPDSFVLVGGALTEMLLSFRPVAVGLKDIKVNIVDSESRELVYAMLVCAEAQGPLISRWGGRTNPWASDGHACTISHVGNAVRGVGVKCLRARSLPRLTSLNAPYRVQEHFPLGSPYLVHHHNAPFPVAPVYLPRLRRTFEVELPVGTVANKKITYTNPYHHFRTFTLRSNQPWLVHFTPPRLQMPAGATRPVGMTFDARAATVGIVDALVFVNDDEDKTEECFKIRVRIYK